MEQNQVVRDVEESGILGVPAAKDGLILLTAAELAAPGETGRWTQNFAAAAVPEIAGTRTARNILAGCTSTGMNNDAVSAGHIPCDELRRR